MFSRFFLLSSIIDITFGSSSVGWSKPVSKTITKTVGNVNRNVNIKYGRFTKIGYWKVTAFAHIKHTTEDLSAYECMDFCNQTPGCIMAYHNTGTWKVCYLYDRVCQEDEFFCLSGSSAPPSSPTLPLLRV